MKIVISYEGDGYEIDGVHEVHEAVGGKPSKKVFEDVEKKNAQKEKTKDKKVK